MEATAGNTTSRRTARIAGSTIELKILMKAMVYGRYGSPDQLELREVETPIPKDNEVLVKVHAASVNRSDWEGLTGKPLYARLGGLFNPGNRILGSDIAGTVERVGTEVRQFQPGDEIFGLMPGYNGGFAEYACAPEKALALKPNDLTFEVASTIPQSGGIALQGIRAQGQVQPGQKVLVNGGGGGTGVFAVQLAKTSGAQVTGVDNTGKLDLMRSLGADQVIDYTRQDFTRNGKQYDLILDLIAYRSVFDYQRALKRNGRYFMVGGSVATMFQAVLLGPWIKAATRKQTSLLFVPPSAQDMLTVAALIQSGKVMTVIDKVYPLTELPEALRYLGEGRAQGKLVITPG